MPWDLLARAYAWTSHGRASMPPRPKLYMPIPFEEEGEVVIAVDTVREPARTGLYRWMLSKGVSPFLVPDISGASIAEADYVRFLKKAV